MLTERLWVWVVLVSWWKLAATALGKKQTRPGQKIRSGLRPRAARSLCMSALLWASSELQIHFFNQEVCNTSGVMRLRCHEALPDLALARPHTLALAAACSREDREVRLWVRWRRCACYQSRGQDIVFAHCAESFGSHGPCESRATPCACAGGFGGAPQ